MYQGYVPETRELCVVFSSCWSTHTTWDSAKWNGHQSKRIQSWRKCWKMHTEKTYWGPLA